GRRRLRSETVRVDDDATSGPLRFVESEIGAAHERFRTLAVTRLSDAPGKGDARPMNGRLAQPPLGEGEPPPRALIRKEHHELVPADPVGRVARAHRRAQALSEGAETGVPGLVAERVVDLLQPVEVEHYEAKAGPGAR